MVAPGTASLLGRARRYLHENRKVVGTGAAILVAAQIVREIRAARLKRKVAQHTKQLRANGGSLRRLQEQQQEQQQKRERKRDLLKNLRALLRILVPRLNSAEVLYLVGIGGLLVARSWFDLWVSRNNARVVKAIVSRNWNTFLRTAVDEMAVNMVPIALTNNILKYAVKSLALRFRRNLTLHFNELYLTNNTFYKAASACEDCSSGVIGLSRVHIDTLLTLELKNFTAAMARAYSDIGQPLLDILFFSRELSKHIGPVAPLQMLIYFIGVGLMLKRITPPLSHLAAKQQRADQNFTYCHSRLVNNAETIAFMGGEKREKDVIMDSFENVGNIAVASMRRRLVTGTFDTVLIKYLATSFGYYLVSRPVFADQEGLKFASSGEILEHYLTNARVLLNMSVSIMRLYSSVRDLSRLAGVASRLRELDASLVALRSGKVGACRAVKGMENLVPGAGSIVRSDIVAFKNVPVVTPTGKVLVNDLSFEVRPGRNLMISGPRETGKSAIMRILCELWPVYGGVVHKPSPREIFFIAQRPFIPIGTLRDQVIYPSDTSDMYARGVTDQDLDHLLADAQLSYLARRDGGWESTEDFEGSLSNDEKQRLALCRLFYHRPRFAILDECTTSMSLTEEEYMLQRCRELGITLITVSNRPSMYKYHDNLLSFDFKGNYTISKIGPNGTIKGPGSSGGPPSARDSMSEKMRSIGMKRVKSHSQIPDLSMMQDERRVLINRLEEIDTMMADIEDSFDSGFTPHTVD